MRRKRTDETAEGAGDLVHAPREILLRSVEADLNGLAHEDPVAAVRKAHEGDRQHRGAADRREERRSLQKLRRMSEELHGASVLIEIPVAQHRDHAPIRQGAAHSKERIEARPYGDRLNPRPPARRTAVLIHHRVLLRERNEADVQSLGGERCGAELPVAKMRAHEDGPMLGADRSQLPGPALLLETSGYAREAPLPLGDLEQIDEAEAELPEGLQRQAADTMDGLFGQSAD